MKLKQITCVSVIMVIMAACSAHSPLILKATTDTTPISQTKYAPHHNPVYVMEAPLPPGAKYEVLAQLEVGKIWYGSSNNVMQSLADGARSIGADAVIEVKTWHQPSGWSWAAPHGSGKAIKITEPASVDFKNLSGTWK